MAMQLFGQDQTAYNAAVAMLSGTGHAAVVHPLSASRAFIGFRLCADHPGRRILWLSPSETVWQMQLAELAAAYDGYQPENVVFAAYRDLSAESAPEADYVVLYDFHCCDDDVLRSVFAVLSAKYPQAPVLGLTDTPVHTENQQNAAAAMFGSHVASELTTGEAIVRGILDPPAYVLSVISWQKDLEAYEQRVAALGNKAERAEASVCLAALRRALEKCGGSDVIFDRHMSDRHGKYIIFTPNNDAIPDYVKLAKEWFGKIDSEMHIYSFCSGDPSAGKSFRDFLEDRSDHLRLLYCMDAPIGCVHAEDLSGVILLRPGGSPLSGIQQTGRALAAVRNRDGIILELSESPGGLAAADAIQDEIDSTLRRYLAQGNEEQILCSTFTVTEMPEMYRELTVQLEELLSGSWDSMYSAAEQYYRQQKSLEIPRYYRTAQGEPLGIWLSLQRNVRTGRIEGPLTDEQIRKLDRIGMRWDSAEDVVWNRYYAAAKAYFFRTHDLMPPADYVTPDGVCLGDWLTQLRSARNVGIYSSYLTPEHIAQLDEIGMVWDVYDFVFERNYQSAVDYYRKHGSLECPQDYVDDQGIRLGAWLCYLRQQFKARGQAILTEEQFRLLDAIGMRWGGKHDVQWNACYQCLVSYCRRTGNTDVPVTWKEGDIPLGRWFRRQKELHAVGELRQDRADRLLALGLNLAIEDPWEKKFQLARAYSEAHDGSLNVPDDYVVNGVSLARWLNEMRLLGEGKRKKKLTDEQRRKLESIGMAFGKSGTDHVWESHYEAVRAYVEQTGSTDIPDDLLDRKVSLRKWLSRQISCMKKRTLDREKLVQLQALGFSEDGTDPFEEGFAHARAYYEQHGDLLVKAKGFRCSDGFDLIAWLRSIRNKKKSGKLPDGRIRRLEAIGMVWNTRKDTGQPIDIQKVDHSFLDSAVNG